MRVLVTRPEPGAGRTAAKLREMGFEPIALPLSETKPLGIASDIVPAVAAAVVVTSANAIRHAPPALIDHVARLPCHAVGRRTAEAARAAGLAQVLEGPGDAIGLADDISEKRDGEVLIYLCGRERFPGFEERLAARRVQVRPIETYETVAIDYSDDTVLARLNGKAIDAMLLYSAKAAEAARGLTARPALQPLLGRTEVYVLSERIAKAFGPPPIPPENGIRIASAPNEEALLALLTRPG